MRSVALTVGGSPIGEGKTWACGKTARVVGPAEPQMHAIKAWSPTYVVNSAASPENGAWQVLGNSPIHDGPDDDIELFAAIGCVERHSPGTEESAVTRLFQYRPRSAYSLTLLLCAGAIGSCAQRRSPSLFAANAVRGALKEHGALPEMRTIPRTVREMRDVASRCLDPRLLSGVRSISGRDFQYQFSEPNRTAQLGVIVLEYPTATVAGQMAAALTPRRNYFRNSKVLTRFSAVVLGALLAVAYSENSGDDRIVGAIDNLGSGFAKASGAGTAPWGESETVKVRQ